MYVTPSSAGVELPLKLNSMNANTKMPSISILVVIAVDIDDEALTVTGRVINRDPNRLVVRDQLDDHLSVVDHTNTFAV